MHLFFSLDNCSTEKEKKGIKKEDGGRWFYFCCQPVLAEKEKLSNLLRRLTRVEELLLVATKKKKISVVRNVDEKVTTFRTSRRRKCLRRAFVRCRWPSPFSWPSFPTPTLSGTPKSSSPPMARQSLIHPSPSWPS